MGTHLSLLGKFNALSLLAMVILALVIGTVLHARIEQRALRGAEQLTSAVGQLTVGPRLTREQLARPLSPLKIAELDSALQGVDWTATHFEHVGLEVVAEGVEEANVLERLRALRCHEAQGYHIARPLPPDALVAWLQARRPAAAQPA